eukprot:TRINITY_DN16536_c0_g1_i2.p1 TRINITY_DN16536_c0_g1~~TRINITY_DN16536_c0_g1_i2.p1  ORF type:complete len:130 (+),score=12.38 TRINITY_DN16536_c0_g1_i2:119-508(+)
MPLFRSVCFVLLSCRDSLRPVVTSMASVRIPTTASTAFLPHPPAHPRGPTASHDIVTHVLLPPSLSLSLCKTGVSILALVCLWTFVALFWWSMWSFYLGVIRADSNIDIMGTYDVGKKCAVNATNPGVC